jgi:TP901 family phage tail tape measure protein
MKDESADITLELQASLDGNIKEDLEKVNEEIEKIGDTSQDNFGKASDSVDKFGKNSNVANEKVKKTDDSIASLGKTANTVKPSLISLPNKLATATENATLKIKKMEENLSGLGRISGIAFAGMAGSTTLAVKKYADFEAGILKVKTISDRSFEEIKKSAEDLSVKYGLSVEQITEGNYQLVSSMGDVANAQEILDTSAKLSIAGFTDYESAMNGLVSVLNGYKMEATEAGRVADILMTVQNKGITTINELQGSLARVTSLANNVNVSFEDLAVALTTITANKVETSEAVTSLRSAFAELGKSSTVASKNFKEATGEMFSEFMKTHTIVDAIQKLEEYSKKTGKSFTDLFGSVEAGNAIMNLAGGNLTKLKNSLDDVKNSSGTANKALGVLDEGADRAFSKLKEQANKAVREIGEALIPTVKDLTKKISEIDWKKVFSQENIDKITLTIKVVGILTGGIWALKTAIGSVKVVLEAINGIMATGAGIKALLGLIGSGFFTKEVITTATSGSFGGAAIFGTAAAGGTTASVTKLAAGPLLKALPYIALMYGENKALKYWDKKEDEVIKNKTTGVSIRERKKSYEEMIKTLETQVEILKKADENEDRYSKKTLKTMEKLKKLKEEYTRLNNSNEGYLTAGNSSKSDIEKWKNLEDKLDSYKKKVFKNKSEISKAIAELSKEGAKDYQLKYFENLKKDYIELDTPKITDGEGKKKKKKEKKEKKDEIKELFKEYEDYLIKAPKIWELIGLDNKEILEEKVSYLKSALQKAVEVGATSLIPTLKTEFDKASKELKLKINEIDFDKAKEKLTKELAKLQEEDITKIGAYNPKSSKEISYEKDVAEYKALKDFTDAIKEGTTEFQKAELQEMMAKKDNLAKKIRLYNQEDKAIKERVAKIESITNGLSSLSGGISSIGAQTGSSTLSNLGSLIGGMQSLGTAFGTLTGSATTTGSLASISSASGIAATAGAGLAAAGAIASGVGAAIGIAMIANSMIDSKAKKKAAAIDAKNKENENIYSEQTKAMQQLTQALMRNSEIIKSFSDRMLSDVAKNPTLKSIYGGEKNFENLYTSMVNGKHFSDISALERGSASVRKMFKKKHKDTYTAVTLSESKLLKYLGFDKTELDAFTDSEIRQLNDALKNISHKDLRKATGRDLTQSNLDEWKKQISEFVTQLDILEREKKELFNGATLESLSGIDYISEKKLIEEYTEQFKQMGLVGEKYNTTIREMAKNNQVLVTAMQDVRAQTIEGLASGNGGFVSSMKTYFEKIFKNASSIAYDVAFSDLDRYFNDEFKKISEKLVNIKKTGKLNFNDLLSGIDFSKLKLAEGIETQAKKSLDTIKQFLLSRGIDISIINKILPNSDFNAKLNDMKNALSNAMNEAQKEKKFDTFTKSLGESLYESTKASLIKAFSESSVYQGLISKFVNTEDMKAEIEKAGTFEGAFNIIKNKLKDFGYRLESNGLGGFDAINNKDGVENKLGNAYYQDKSSNIEIKVTNNFYEKVYGVDDLDTRILKSVNKGIELWDKRPKISS